MYSDFELLNSVQSCTNPISTRTWESNIISVLRMQKRTLDLSLREWVRGEWEVEKKGSVSSRRLKSLGSAQPWTSFLRLDPIWTNLVSEPWTSSKWPNTGDLTETPVCPFSLPFCFFFTPGTNCCRSEFLFWKSFDQKCSLNTSLNVFFALGKSWHIFATFMWSKWTRES